MFQILEVAGYTCNCLRLCHKTGLRMFKLRVRVENRICSSTGLIVAIVYNNGKGNSFI